MATNNKWIESLVDSDNNLTQPTKVVTSGMTNPFSTKVVLSLDKGMKTLLEYIKDPAGATGIFTDYSKWLSSIILYPFDVNYWKTLNGITRDDYGLSIGGKKIGETNADKIIVCEDFSVISTMYNLGEYFVSPHFNNFADYNGYTKIQVYLPFFGFVDVNPNDVVGKYLQIRLQVDMNTGMGQYYIGVSEQSVTNPLPPYQRTVDDSNTRIISTHDFQLGIHIPLGQTNAFELVRNITLGAVKGAITLTGLAVGGGIGAGISTATTTVAPKITTRTVKSPTSGRQVIASRWKTEGGEKTKTYDHTNAYKGQAINEVFNLSAQALNNLNYSVQIDRPNNSLANCFGSQSVKIVIYRPKMLPVDENYNHLYGQPLGEVRQLSTISGYTEVSKIFFSGEGFNNITSYEYALIEEAFGSGVILP